MISQASTNIMSSFKIMLISTTVLSAAIMLKFSIPAIADFAIYDVPSIYNGVVSWLRPPYLYLLINCIIITIVASTKLQSRKDDLLPPLMQGMSADAVHPQPAVAAVSEKRIQTEYPRAEYAYNGGVPNDSSVYQVDVQKRLDFDDYERLETREGTKNNQSPVVVHAAFAEDAMSNKENEYVVGKSSWNEAKIEYLPAEYSPSNVKPSVSARFIHRRNIKASPEGGKTVLGVSKPKRNGTLESTWKTITDGRPMPLTRHLRKSDTWEREHVVPRQEKTMAKAATFNTGTACPGSGSSGKLRREPSLSQDELNRRVEAFIKKFNEEMRLQRQESLNQYKEMINRGSH